MNTLRIRVRRRWWLFGAWGWSLREDGRRRALGGSGYIFASSSDAVAAAERFKWSAASVPIMAPIMEEDGDDPRSFRD